MTTFFLTLIVMAASILLLSVGLFLTGRRLRGSCGGLAGSSCACANANACPKKAGLERPPGL